MPVWSAEPGDHDCTREEFALWGDQLSNLLMGYEPRVCDATGYDTGERSMQLDLYGRQVKRLLEELTLLAHYKACYWMQGSG